MTRLEELKLKQVAPEVLYATEPFATAGPAAVSLIKTLAGQAPRQRCRICFHPSPDAPSHEMLIAMSGASYVRPHRHGAKTETLLVLEGAATAHLFDENGRQTDALPLKPFGHGEAFFYRMPAGIFHTLTFQSDWFVYLETTLGPFDAASSEAAPWAPPEDDQDAGRAYLAGL